MDFVIELSPTPVIELQLQDREPSWGSLILENVVIGADAEHYDGEYIITPSGQIQRLETDDKMMDDDVTVLAIPYAETTNQFGGKTATIG